ncbi:MAG: hypothetical protein ABSC18_16555 [Verrucomicrobiota bacterium]
MIAWLLACSGINDLLPALWVNECVIRVPASSGVSFDVVQTGWNPAVVLKLKLGHGTVHYSELTGDRVR